MERADAVLFDLDGVLVDSRGPFARCVNVALAAHGLPAVPDDELHRYLGPPLHGTFAQLAGPQLVQPCVDVYREHYREVAASQTTVFPGIRATLARLAAGRPLVVATSKPQAMAEPLLASLGLRRFFTAVVGPSLEAEHESKAATIRRALLELPRTRRAVMVGDRKFDVAGARENGIASIGVLWGIGSEQELTAAGATALARRPHELLELVGS